MAKLNQPSFYVYAITDDDHMLRIGAAWENKNGNKGFFVRLKAQPMDGRLLLLPPKDKETQKEDTHDTVATV